MVHITNTIRKSQTWHIITIKLIHPGNTARMVHPGNTLLQKNMVHIKFTIKKCSHQVTQLSQYN